MAITLLTLEEVTRRYGIPAADLEQMITAGRISAITMNGYTLVDETEVRRMSGGNQLHWISFEEAAARLGTDLLERLIKDGVIRKKRGVLLVAREDVESVAAQLDGRNFRHLDGVPISMSEASRRYFFSVGSIFNWVRKGYIRTLSTGSKEVFVNEADVAYARALANVRGLRGGRALFPVSPQYRPR